MGSKKLRRQVLISADGTLYELGKEAGEEEELCRVLLRLSAPVGIYDVAYRLESIVGDAHGYKNVQGLESAAGIREL